MPIRRLYGPDLIVRAADIVGSAGDDQNSIYNLIEAVQGSIDGPTGWLGRSLGRQQLELSVDGFRRSIRLPYGPVMSIASVTYRDRTGVVQTVDASAYRLSGGNRCLFGTSFSLPCVEAAPDAVTVTYEAGYEPTSVPPAAKMAVIIGVRQLKAMSEQSLYLREEQVEGIGSTVYTVSDAANSAVRAATEMLLAPLRVYSL